MKFLNVFQPVQKGNQGLTDEAVYKSIQYDEDFIPLYGAYKEHTSTNRFVSVNGKTKLNKPITIFEGEGIIVNFDGQGGVGRMTFKKDEKFAINHHVGFFQIRENARKKIDMEFFALFYQNLLRDMSVSADSSASSSTLSLDQLYKIEFEFPKHEDQIKIMSLLKPLLLLKKQVLTLHDKIKHNRELILSETYQILQEKNVPINRILDYQGGNPGLTEETIYQKILQTGERYEVISGSTVQELRLGTIPITKIKARQLKTFTNKDGILVIRVGKAGMSFFLKKGKYTITDNVYILYLKDNCQYKINLKWLMYQLKAIFFQYSPTAEYGAWNMTGFFENVYIGIPSETEQNLVVKKYEKIEELENTLKMILYKIETLQSKQISVPVFV